MAHSKDGGLAPTDESSPVAAYRRSQTTERYRRKEEKEEVVEEGVGENNESKQLVV